MAGIFAAKLTRESFSDVCLAWYEELVVVHSSTKGRCVLGSGCVVLVRDLNGPALLWRHGLDLAFQRFDLAAARLTKPGPHYTASELHRRVLKPLEVVTVPGLRRLEGDAAVGHDFGTPRAHVPPRHFVVSWGSAGR